MAEILGVEWALAWMREAEARIVAAREDLNELDRAIGDGDHGENMARGFTAVGEELAAREPETVPAVLAVVARTLISTVGGASGPLYGTAFLRASKSAPDRVDARGVTSLLLAGLDGVVARGGAAPGDKTMVDALAPALAASRNSPSPHAALAAAAAAAAEAAKATEPLIAHKGRASYLGERAMGHRDPGAQSMAIILAAGAAAAGEAP